MRRCIWTAAVLLCAVVGRTYAQSPNDVIINEVVQGSSLKDACELLITAPGGIDLRGWMLTDLSSPTSPTGSSEGILVFPDRPFLQNIAAFTRIVVVCNAGGATLPLSAEDTVASDDSTLVLMDSTLLGGTGSLHRVGTVSLSSDDNLVLVTGPSLTAGTVVDIMSWGTGNISGWTSTWMNPFTFSPGNAAVFTNPSSGNLNNDDGSDGWSTTPESNHTLGRANPGQFLEGKPLRVTGLTHSPVSPLPFSRSRFP